MLLYGYHITGSSEAVEECFGENSPDSQSNQPLRANTTTQVCWHRMATVGMADMQAVLKVAAVACQLLSLSKTMLLTVWLTMNSGYCMAPFSYSCYIMMLYISYYYCSCHCCQE